MHGTTLAAATDGVEYAFDNDVRPLGGPHPTDNPGYFTFDRELRGARPLFS